MEKTKQKTVVDKIWDAFASVKFAAIIFAAIALTSIVGTVLEQNAEPAKNMKILVKFFGEGAAPAAYEFFDALGFMNMYHSWWFLAMLFLFCSNLIICSIDRLPRIWKLVTEPIHPLAADHLEKMSIHRVVTLKGKQAAGEAIAAAMESIGFKPASGAVDKDQQFFSEKGNYTRLGVYITHLSILVIILGALVGTFFGFNAFLNLPEGEFSNVAYMDRGREVPLGFEIRCDNFDVEYYGESDMPKSYRSWLTVLKNGQVIKQKSITVNDPLTYEGITFYQSSYGIVPDSGSRGIAVLRAVSKEGKSQEVQVRVGDTFTIPGTGIEARVVNYSPALSFDPAGRPFTYEENMSNPAVFLEFSGAQKFSGWVFKRLPRTWQLPDGNRVEFLDYWGVQYTGMQVRKDPGVWIVYLGCLIMAVGLYITFFMSHRRIWVNVSEDKGGVKVLVAASAHRNKAAFERTIDKLAGMITAGQKGGK